MTLYPEHMGPHCLVTLEAPIVRHLNRGSKLRARPPRPLGSGADRALARPPRARLPFAPGLPMIAWDCSDPTPWAFSELGR